MNRYLVNPPPKDSEEEHLAEVHHFVDRVNRRWKNTPSERDRLKSAMRNYPNKNHKPVNA